MLISRLNPVEISVVTTLYRSDPFINEFYSRIKAQLEKLTQDYEIVFVNDGSPDQSLQTAISLYQQDRRVKVVDLSRNFGHHKAIMTGLAATQGELVFLIDVDLEEEPELLHAFLDVYRANECDVVYGVQKTRKGSWFEKLSGEIFYRLSNRILGVELPRNLVTARLMSRRYVESLLRFRESTVFLGGIWQITGYTQVALPITKHSKGETSYTLARKFSLFVTAVTSFSSKPLIYIFYLGLFISLVAFLLIAYLLIRKIFFNSLLIGWTSLMASLWFLSGLSISIMGLLGIYLSQIFIEAKARPYTIIRTVYEHPGKPVVKQGVLADELCSPE